MRVSHRISVVIVISHSALYARLRVIDQTGLMEPREIIWPDGRKFPIDRVECWRKALDHGPETTYYVIEIGGRKRILYFTQSPICSIVNMGRWYVESAHQ